MTWTREKNAEVPLNRTKKMSVYLLIMMTHVSMGAAYAQGQEPGAPGKPAVQPVRSLEVMKKTQQELLRRLIDLERKNQDQELQLLKMQGEAEAASGGEVTRQADEEADLKEKTFRGGQRALQALNPEISVVGDAFGKVILNEYLNTGENDRAGFVFRVVGLHLQSDLDPFSFAKICIGVTPAGVGLGEAYLTWTSVLPGLSITLGKFRQEFGVVNRWHVPGLDQVDFPLALRTILGPEGLNQIGVSVDWLMPKLWAHANHLVLQVTNGQNEQLFAGKYFSIPAVMLRLKSYWDLSESTYFELGLTGMLGWNNARAKKDASGNLDDEDWRETWVWGADWTLMWEPLKRAKYLNLVIRGELYGARKELADGTITAVGLYQYIQAKVARRWEVGARFDWTMPFSVDNDGKHVFGVQPYVNWWQSPWVRTRLLYAYTNSDLVQDDDHRLLLQVTFAVGPHKHERY